MLDLIRRGLEELEKENSDLRQSVRSQKREYESKLAEIKRSFQEQYKQKVRLLKRRIDVLTAENKRIKGNSVASEEMQTEKEHAKGKSLDIDNTKQHSDRIKAERRASTDSGREHFGNSSLEEAFPQPKRARVCQKSPTKILMYQGKPLNVHEYTDSEFNLLPTQYSLQVSANSPDRPAYVKFSSSPAKETVEDSQDPCVLAAPKSPEGRRRPLQDMTTNSANIPGKLTKLQRRDFLRKMLEEKLDDESFMLDLTTNPITELPWSLTDFKPNAGSEMKPPAGKIGVSLVEQNHINEFYKSVGGKVHEMPESQLYDKFPSPPGFMTSEFPLTQEAVERRQVVLERQNERLLRRLILSLRREEYVFYEEVFNRFVERGRFLADAGFT